MAYEWFFLLAVEGRTWTLQLLTQLPLLCSFYPSLLTHLPSVHHTKLLVDQRGFFSVNSKFCFITILLCNHHSICFKKVDVPYYWECRGKLVYRRMWNKFQWKVETSKIRLILSPFNDFPHSEFLFGECIYHRRMNLMCSEDPQNSGETVNVKAKPQGLPRLFI